MSAKLQPIKHFRVNWICFSCGRKLKSRRALYSHLQHCYWYAQFKDHIEDAPFYRVIPSKQLRYYYRNRPDLLKRRKERRKELKKLGEPGARGLDKDIKTRRIPKTLK